MGDFRRLKVWQLSAQLAAELYLVTGRFPREEQFGLTSQCRRAAVSVVSNIAEGSGRGTPAEFRRFLSIARGSLHELAAQLLLSRQLGFLTEAELQLLEQEIDEISRMLLVLSRPK